MWTKKLLVAVGVGLGLVTLMARPGLSAAPSGIGSCHTVTQANIAYDTVVSCGAGELVVGGGGRCYGFGGNWESWMAASYPSGQGWALRCENVKSGTKQLSGETYAVCCKP